MTVFLYGDILAPEEKTADLMMLLSTLVSGQIDVFKSRHVQKSFDNDLVSTLRRSTYRGKTETVPNIWSCAPQDLRYLIKSHLN